MRDSNNKSVTANKAAVSITSTLYDRRALDCTEDKPLVNSLNHLTFLASSSLKVREALSQDGGLERLVDILYECQSPTTEKEKCISAWKWVLAFQCLVLVGTRGNERIRKKVVDAGMIPIIATILDNYVISKKTAWNSHLQSNKDHYLNVRTTSTANTTVTEGTSEISDDLLTNASSFTAATDESQLAQQQQRSNEMYDDFNNDQINEVFQNVRRLVEEANQTVMEAEAEIQKHEQHKKKTLGDLALGDAEAQLDEEYSKISKSLTFLNFLDRLNTTDDISKINQELLTSYSELTRNAVFTNQLVNNPEISNILRENMSSTDLPFFRATEDKFNQSIPRNFENGILIPKEDDVIWSLQVLAFISKYTYLRYKLADTYIVNGLSLRNYNIPPPLETDCDMNETGDLLNDIYDDEDSSEDEDVANDLNEFVIPNENRFGVASGLTRQQFPENLWLGSSSSKSKRQKYSDRKCESKYAHLLRDYNSLINEQDRIEKATKLEKFALNISRYAHREHNILRLRNNQIYKRKREKYASTWDYDEWDDFEMGPLSLMLPNSQTIDPNIRPIKRVNIFPLVEKFTVKHLHSKDITYWASVIVRNSNRKDESKGGRRQCAYFGCGKWEDEPRQFAKCRRCKRAKYCSKECQSKAWTYHKYWCNAASGSTSTNTASGTEAGAQSWSEQAEQTDQTDQDQDSALGQSQ
ncbi:hypothetical protein KL929_003950 [Ogataea haglerorum]|nr:hypothetical protein KL951_004124 [Ogataea haglerorum]KAG7785831.1 hypothetical protein KL945_003610 [Ogataea haglerorum]KAG7793911.1 hypothetical protein KL910_000606 [Ogataea haglerorum]KAG7795599.1 hypothetical protein KL929_003950 [Ogataea haglerorum]